MAGVEEFEDLLTIQQVGSILGVDEDTVRWWLRTNQLAGYKIGKIWRIPKAVVQQLLEAARNTPGPGSLVTRLKGKGKTLESESLAPGSMG